MWWILRWKVYISFCIVFQIWTKTSWSISKQHQKWDCCRFETFQLKTHIRTSISCWLIFRYKVLDKKCLNILTKKETLTMHWYSCVWLWIYFWMGLIQMIKDIRLLAIELIGIAIPNFCFSSLWGPRPVVHKHITWCYF